MFGWAVRSSVAPHHSRSSHKTNYTRSKYHDYDHDLDYKRDKHDYRIEKSRKPKKSSPERQDEVQVEVRALQDEYISKAQQFVERNKPVIDSGAMFQMQPVVSKAKLRFKVNKCMCSIFHLISFIFCNS